MKKFIIYCLLCITMALPVMVTAEVHPQVTDDISTAVVNIAVKATGVEIVVNDDQTHDVTIYAITGQIVKHINVAEGSTTIDLVPGCYIVRVDRLSKRVVVK
ncbi:MAG: T9SS type A sorting domain-containing protein [Odoribacter sp.]|nr:T9SS type A sorting domain-containing protein [Odoribacter sp.]